MEDTNGGASGLNMLQHAVRAVQTGDASAVLVMAGDRLSSRDFLDLVNNYNSTTRDFLAPLPYGGPNSLFALLTMRHMAAHGLRREDYGHVAIAQRRWATRNPGAVYRSPLTLTDYLESPMVAEPLCRYDCVPVVAGADAVVIIPSDRRVAKQKAVAVRALRSSHNQDQQESDGLQSGLAHLSPGLWNEASVAPTDVDVACIYDDYPVMVLIQLADLGLVSKGDVQRFVRKDLTQENPALNTSGGQLSAGQAGAAGGLHGLVEAVRQLRREARARQVRGARTAVVTGYGMVLYRYGACANAVILERTS
jgi:acetyl-CoA acetyltransferase